MLRGDAFPLVGNTHSQADFAQAANGCAFPGLHDLSFDADRGSFPSVLESIVQEVLKDLRKFVRISHNRRTGGHRDLDPYPSFLRPERQPLGKSLDDRRKIDAAAWQMMLLEFDAREAEKIFYQAGHSLSLLLHDGQKVFQRLLITPRRPLQRFYEANQTGKGRSQFVARVGDKVDT